MPNKSFEDMTDEEIKTELKRICAESSTKEEIEQKLEKELDYHFGAAINTHLPTDQTGREARMIVSGLGGPIMKNGAMVMMMIHGPRGTIQI